VNFYHGKLKAFETAPLQINEGLDPKSKALPLKFSIPLAKLAAGKYTCQVYVVDPEGQEVAFWRAPIMLM
jgi:hypothetical protein